MTLGRTIYIYTHIYIYIIHAITITITITITIPSIAMCLCERQCICGSACYSNCDDFLSIVGMPQMVPLRITRVGCQAPMPTRCGRRTVAHQRSGKAGRGCSVAQAHGCHGNLSLGASSLPGVNFCSFSIERWLLPQVMSTFFGQG